MKPGLVVTMHDISSNICTLMYPFTYTHTQDHGRAHVLDLDNNGTTRYLSYLQDQGGEITFRTKHMSVITRLEERRCTAV